MRAVIAGAFCALLLSPPASAQEPAQGASRSGTIAVDGSGEVQLKPDFARILALVSTQADTVAQATDANRAATERVLARVASLGIKREDIATVDFQVARTPPPVGPDARERRVPRFTANHMLRITSRDIDGVGRLAGEILASGDMTFQDLDWHIDRPQEGSDEARRNAVRDARRKAEVYAAAAGATLGRLMEVQEGTKGSPHRSEADEMRVAAAPAVQRAEVPIVPPATVRYWASVHMVWEITP
jgi:hypothetical protein